MLEGMSMVRGVNWGRSPIRGRAREFRVKPESSIKGDARTEGAKRPRILLRAKPESKAKPKSKAKPELARGRGLGGGLVSPPENLWKFVFETVQSGVWLKRKSNFSQWRIQEFADQFSIPAKFS